MNNDGWGQSGAGASDMRIAGHDLQHNRQTRTADETHVPVRIVTQSNQGGGPMKEHMQHMEGQIHKHPMHKHLEEEKHRHEAAMGHHKHHLEKHHSRNYNSQHGHDSHSY